MDFLASKERNTNLQKSKCSNIKDVEEAIYRTFEELIILLFKEQWGKKYMYAFTYTGRHVRNFV